MTRWAEVVKQRLSREWLINQGATLPHNYRTDDLYPVSDDEWEIEMMCKELEWLVAKEWDVASAVLTARLNV